MEISWFGHSCFCLRDSRVTAITDPFDRSSGYSLPRLQADIVTVSHDHPHHNHTQAVKGNFKVIDRPGEYEIKSVFITGIATFPSPPWRDETAARGERRNIIFVFEFDGLTICHLGNLAAVPTEPMVEALSNVDVLLVPVGGGDSMHAAQAAETVSLIEPRLVIPMHYKTPATSVELDGVDKFLKAMGAGQEEAVGTLKVTLGSLPETTQVVVLTVK